MFRFLRFGQWEFIHVSAFGLSTSSCPFVCVYMKQRGLYSGLVHAGHGCGSSDMFMSFMSFAENFLFFFLNKLRFPRLFCPLLCISHFPKVRRSDFHLVEDGS